MGSLPRAFQRAIDGVRILPLSPQWVAQKVILFVFWLKWSFSRIKCATKFLYVKNSSGKVVCSITIHRYWRET